jgi:AraC-like DNA-binding protein
VLIDKSSGTRFIGDSVSHFQDGDLCFIGSNIPHLYRNSEEHYARKSKLRARSVFVHFTRDFLGNDFFDAPEMKHVHRLLVKTSSAFEIHGKSQKSTIAILRDMEIQNPAQRLMSLLEILVCLSQSAEVKPLLSTDFSANTSLDTERINKVFEFIMSNYTQEMYVLEIASKLGMSVASFSRYFKHHTRKTFSDYVTEIRIGHACRLLMEDSYSVSEVSYQSGFSNLANFYRHFKKNVGVIPKHYRNTFLK